MYSEGCGQVGEICNESNLELSKKRLNTVERKKGLEWEYEEEAYTLF